MRHRRDDRVGEPRERLFIFAGGSVLVQSAACGYLLLAAYNGGSDLHVMWQEIGWKTLVMQRAAYRHLEGGDASVDIQ